MLELTPAQQDIYLEGQLFGKVLNNIGGYQKYHCKLDIPRFLHARALLLQHNDAYQLRFHETGGICTPYIGNEPTQPLCVTECSNEASALAWIQEQFEMPFSDLSTTVFKDALIKLGSDEYWYFAKAHHLIMDGWGFALQMQRFLRLYECLAEPDAIATLEQSSNPSFIDYMQRQSAYRNSAAYRQSRAYWLARHAETSGALFASVGGQTTVSGSRRISIVLDVQLIAALRQLAAEANANLVAVMYAALYVYFSRAHQRHDITIGSPVHNRRSAADKDIIGSVVNVNAHRLTASADMTFLGLVEHIASVQRQDYRHSRFPLGDLVRALRENLDAATEPLYEIAFNYQKLDFQLAIDGQPVDTHYLSHSHERVPLTFVLCEYGEDQDVRLHLDYATGYFDESQSDALLERLLGLLRQISEESKRRISEYRLLTSTELLDQFVTWQGAKLPLREDVCIPDFFEAQVLRSPDRVAVTCANASLTYVELNDRANRLAGQLIDQGAGPGRFIGICHSRSLNLIVAMLAVLKSGSAYVPIDPAYPQARVQYILDDSQLAIVVADAQGAAVLGTCDCVVIDTGAMQAEAFRGEPACPNPARSVTGLSAEDLAYVIYTSGSTGQPKGVLIEHRNAAAFIQWALGHFAADALASVLAATSICFDLSIFELFVPLAAGGRVVLVKNVLALKDEHIEGLSLINTVPSAIRGLLDAKAIPSSVCCINLAGELLRQELVDALYAQLGSVKIYDLYGPSESTTYSTFGLRTKGGDTTIGRPIANTRIYVLDESGNPLPTGMVGELFIGGAGVARGYLNRPAATAERFAFNQHADERVYRTGDLVRFVSDGRLKYLGRKDGQEKIRGHRVEPGEIEACLLEHPWIADCVVVSRESLGQVDGKFLVAYVVKAKSADDADNATGDLSAMDLTEFVAARLPAYMVPSQFVPLPVLPLTPNGKVDRHALPAPGDTERREVYVAPSNDIEQRLCTLWQATLKQERIGIYDNFFMRGGDSLLLLKLASAIEGEFDLYMDLPLLFASPTIETQSRFLLQQMELAQMLLTVSTAREAHPSSYVDL